MTKHYNVRSFSLPARSHPALLKTEQEINNLKSLQISSSSKSQHISTALSSLEDLHRRVGDVFTLSQTQEALSKHNNQKWVNELLEGLLKYLDICGNARDGVVLMKESVRELQSALRRSKCGETTVENDVSAYISTRKKMKKEITKTLVSLKQMDNLLGSGSDPDTGICNVHLSSVVRMLREAGFVTSFIFQSLLSFLSVPMMKPKPTKWSLLVHKLMQKSKVVGATNEGQNWEVNELESVDIGLCNILIMETSREDIGGETKTKERIEDAKSKLEELDGVIMVFEEKLECLFRRLIHARVSLLNILSH